MKLPLVKRSLLEATQKQSDQYKRELQVFATLFKKIQDLCEDHNQDKMGNIRLCNQIKKIVGKEKVEKKFTRSSRSK
tara:strand:+ start:960 stop:1190 length:231 start_codon:yes stop_codon:yes gene_type:complete